MISDHDTATPSNLSYLESKPGSVCLSGELTLAVVRSVRKKIVAALEANAELQVDLLNVTAIDTAGVQLLLALELEAQRLGRTIVWLGFSLAVEDAVELLNVAPHLSRPSAVIWS